MARLYTQASRLSAKDLLTIWDSATPNEQAVLVKVLQNRRKKYLDKANKEMSPAQRASDPTYQRMVNIIPGAPIF